MSIKGKEILRKDRIRFFLKETMWAIVKIAGKLYRVEEGKTILVEKLNDAKDVVTFDQVLALGGEKVTIGTPLVDKAKVKGKILDTKKGKKVRVVKFKSKSRYLKTYGARQERTRVLIEKIQTA